MSAVIRLDQFRPSAPVQQDGYMATPNSIEDALLASPLTHRQERVYRAILRKTLGFGKACDCIATSQIASMTMIDERHVRRSVAELEAKGMMVRGRRVAAGTFLTPVLDTAKWAFFTGTNGPNQPEQQTGQIGPNSDVNGPNQPEHQPERKAQTGRFGPPQKTIKTSTHKQPSSCGDSTEQSVAAADAAVAGKPATRSAPSVSEQLVAMYHETCPTLPEVKLLSAARREAIKHCWMQAGRDMGRYDPKDVAAGLAWWARFFAIVNASDFLSKRSGKFRGCNIDWLMKQANFLKVVEGNYDNEDNGHAR